MSTLADRMIARTTRMSWRQRLRAKFDRSAMATARARALDTAQRLDRFEPGWQNKIDLNALNFASMGQCIFGQLFGEIRLLNRLHPVYAFLDSSETYWGCGLVPTPFCPNKHLIQAWSEEIAARTVRAIRGGKA